MISFKRRAAFACAALLFFDLFVFLLTQAPTAQFIDSGELAVVCKTLGIAHPTGYPLYTLLGRLFCLLPVRDVIFRVSLMSLLLTCTANIILFFILVAVGQSFSKRKDGRPVVGIWSAFVACLIFSFTPTLWSQATSNEVYSLNVLFYSLIILLVLRWQRSRRESGGDRIPYLLAFVYALSFGNHMSTILLLPGITFIVVSGLGKGSLRLRKAAVIPVLYLLGVSVYLFLPIRSSQNPIMDWGNPESWTALVRHVTGWQYQVWMFAGSAQELFTNFKNFIELFFHQFPFYLLPFSILGIWRLFARDRNILVFLLFLFFANILYGVNYGIPDIDPYFLGSFLVNAIFIGIGLHFVFQLTRNSKMGKRLASVIILLFMLLPLIQLKKNYFQADRSGDFFAYDFGSNIMRSVKKDAIILTNVWDHYSPWLYLRFVELKRPDVSYLDTELCRRSWYFDYVEQSYGHLYQTSEGEIKRFLREVQPFENRQPFEPQVIERAYIKMLNSFLIKNFKNRPLYDDLIGGPEVGKMFLRIPEGMVFSLKDSLKSHPYEFPDFELRGVQDRSIFKNDRTLFNLKRYPLMIDLRLRYLSSFKRQEEADRLLKKYQTLLSEPIQ
ncbi:MAG: DUF2723 domain-containing protein [candidate division Zixibacteria bacterium]|nr:DUF2723 domain-containing protein [candidate division Zixibacteria bacterium]